MRTLALVLLLAGLATPLCAQETAPLSARLHRGDRVRVMAPAFSDERVVAVVDSVAGPDLLLVRPGDARMSVPLSIIRQVEVSRGADGGRRARLMALGGALGLAVGFLAREVARDDPGPLGGELEPREKRSTAADVLPFAGAAAGVLVGFTTGGERWTPVFRATP